MQPDTSVAVQTHTEPAAPLRLKKFPKQKHFLAVFFISFIWGTFGVDRMYLGKWGTGFLKLITFGGFGLWVMVDLLIIMSGKMRDKWGRPMREVAEYKGFAYRTILIFAIVLGLIVLINGIALILAVSQFITGVQDGTIPGLDMLNGLQGGAGGLSPEEASQLGL